MKMIRAIVRPDAADEVVKGLSEAGYNSLTRFNAFGRGKQKGVTVGTVNYDELPKIMLLMVVEDESAGEVTKIIQDIAHTGNIGDGKIFVSAMEEAYTVRTGSSVL